MIKEQAARDGNPQRGKYTVDSLRVEGDHRESIVERNWITLLDENLSFGGDSFFKNSFDIYIYTLNDMTKGKFIFYINFFKSFLISYIFIFVFSIVSFLFQNIKNLKKIRIIFVIFVNKFIWNRPLQKYEDCSRKYLFCMEI